MCWKNFSSWDSRKRRDCGLELRTDWTSGKTGHWPEGRNGEEAPCAGRAVPQGERRGRPTVWRAAQGGVLIKCPLFSTVQLNSISITTKYVCIYRVQNIFLRCPTPRLHCFLSSHWPSFRFLSFMAFFIPSIQFFFGLPHALICFSIHFNAILGSLSSAILWTWPYHVSWFCSVSFIVVSSSPVCCLIVIFLILSFLDILEQRFSNCGPRTTSGPRVLPLWSF